MTTIPFPPPLSSPIRPSGSESPWQAAADEPLVDRFRVWLHEKGLTPDRLARDPEVYEDTFRDISFVFLRRVFQREIESLDDGAPEIERDGKRFRRMAPTPGTLMTLFGPVTVSRPRYRPVAGASVIPIDESLDLKAGSLTPAAARVTLHALSLMTVRDCQALIRALGPSLDPSVSTMTQLAHDAGDRWEAVRDTVLAAIRETETVPEAATTVAVSLDGVHVHTLADYRSPAGWREAACGVVELRDGEGERLRTVRCGHMPETKKAGLKRDLAAELDHVRRTASTALTVVAIADGALENWAWLSGLDPDVEILDLFQHAEFPTMPSIGNWGILPGKLRR